MRERLSHKVKETIEAFARATFLADVPVGTEPGPAYAKATARQAALPPCLAKLPVASFP